MDDETREVFAQKKILVQKQAKKKLVWPEKSGLLTPIARMSDHHLKCTIEMIQQSILAKKYWRSMYLPYLKEEWRYRRALIKKHRRRRLENDHPH